LALYHDISQGIISVRESDIEKRVISSRVQSEGLSFLTKTLPSYGKAVDTALHSEASLQVPFFEKRAGTAIPKFLGWLLEKIFTNEGHVRSNPDVYALKAFRQLVYFMYKLQLPYTQQLNEKVIEEFVSTEIELSSQRIDFGDPIIKTARTFVSRLFRGFDCRDIFPSHGPGAVATGEASGEKSNFSRLYTCIEVVYPYTEYFCLGSAYADDRSYLESLTSLEAGTAKVVLVPKDSRGPRLISCEPLEFQWIQQGLCRKLYSWIEAHRLTRGHVNFTDQTVNRELALLASRTCEYATMDMKDASDRVSLELVKNLFSGTSLLEGLLASRSEMTRLPDGRVVKLHKFAPMGSAVCFPIEALCFYALSYAILRRYGYRADYARKAIYVYGDDIIVRSEVYKLLLQHFPNYGLRFNMGKCCVSGFFRESCGCDAFKGIDVTPIRLRKTWSHRDTWDSSEILAYVEQSNALHKAGYFTVADAIQIMVENRYGALPFLPVEDTTGIANSVVSGSKDRTDFRYSGYIAFQRYGIDHREANRKRGIRVRWNSDLHRLEVRSWTIRGKNKVFPTYGWQSVFRALMCGSTDLPAGVFPLPRRICRKRGWIAPPLY